MNEKINKFDYIKMNEFHENENFHCYSKWKQDTDRKTGLAF